MVKHHCPKCEETDVNIVEHMDVECVVCKTCGFDERDELEMASTERSSQKEKRLYSKYKTGGADRAQK